jgi:hypothetical protein
VNRRRFVSGVSVTRTGMATLINTTDERPSARTGPRSAFDGVLDVFVCPLGAFGLLDTSHMS